MIRLALRRGSVLLLSGLLLLAPAMPLDPVGRAHGLVYPSRGLTEQQQALVEHLFPETVDPASVRVVSKPQRVHAQVRGTTIYLDSGAGSSGRLDRTLLAHEATHIHQQVAGLAPDDPRPPQGVVAAAAVLAAVQRHLHEARPDVARSPYDVTEEEAQEKGWHGLGLEQQAEVVAAFAAPRDLDRLMTRDAPYADVVADGLGEHVILDDPIVETYDLPDGVTLPRAEYTGHPVYVRQVEITRASKPELAPAVVRAILDEGSRPSSEALLVADSHLVGSGDLPQLQVLGTDEAEAIASAADPAGAFVEVVSSDDCLYDECIETAGWLTTAH